MLERVRSYLQLFRAQTAPATVLLLAGGYYAAGGTDPQTAGLLVLAGVLAHWGSFGHNSCSDYPYDQDDPSKQHHPLHDGRLSLLDGLYAVYACQLASLALFVTLAWPNPHALILLTVFITTGYMYNSAGFSSQSIHAAFPITVSFTSLAAYAGYIATTPDWWFTAMVAVLLWGQIDYLGRLKEIGTGEPSYIKKLGAHVDEGRFEPGWSTAYAWTIQSAQLGLLGVLLYQNYTDWRALLTLLLVPILIYTWLRLTSPRTYNRDDDLDHMGTHEALTTVLAAALVMPWQPTLVLGLGGIAWFVTFNRALWDSTAGPQV